MTINRYFNLYSGNANEQDLVQSLVTECIQQYGMDLKYLPRESGNFDYLFKEDPLASFNTVYTIEMYLVNVDQWEGDGDLLSKFGIQITDRGTLAVSAARFAEEIPSLQKPREGDLIYFPLANTLFEIRFVEDEQQFYPVGRVPQYVLTIEAYQYSNEEFNTGDDTLDDMINYDPSDDESDDLYDESDEIETEGEAVVDFTEENPFGTF